MSWLISTLIAGLVYTSTANYPVNQPVNLDSSPAIIVTAEKNANGDETERFEKTYSLNSNGKVSVSNVNGSITIEAWDKNEVKLVAVKTADSKERLAQLEISIDSKPDSLKIETDYGRWNNGNWNCNSNCRLNVDYHLVVPRGAMLNEIETVNGSVNISNMTNFTRASAVNGTVKATNLQGTAHIETVNGTTEASFERLNDTSKINLSTVNGQVNLIIPSDSDATLKAESVNGRIANDFGLTVRKGKYVGRDLYGKVGDGRAKITLESVNGGLNVKRQQDGKNIKPITNLLPAKDEDEMDEMDVSVNIDTDEMNRGIATSVRESTKKAVKESMKVAQQAPKIAAQALKDTQKAMAEVNLAMQDVQFEMEEFSTPKIEVKTETFKVTGIPKITINTGVCPVSVKGWDKSEVKYRIKKLTRFDNEKALDYTVEHSDSEVKIITSNNTDEFPLKSFSIEILAPRKSNLQIKSSDEIRVEGITGNIGLTGSSFQQGSINVRDSGGKLKLKAAESIVRVVGFDGEIDSQTRDTNVFFEGNFDKLSAKVIGGSLVLTLPEDANADISANTSINIQGFELNKSEETDDLFRRLGKGGAKFNLEVDGNILIRNSNALIAKY